MNNTQKPKIEKVFEEIQKHIGYSGNVKINIDDKIIKIDFKRTHFINDDQMNLTRAKFKMWLENKYLHIIDRKSVV